MNFSWRRVAWRLGLQSFLLKTVKVINLVTAYLGETWIKKSVAMIHYDFEESETIWETRERERGDNRNSQHWASPGAFVIFSLEVWESRQVVRALINSWWLGRHALFFFLWKNILRILVNLARVFKYLWISRLRCSKVWKFRRYLFSVASMNFSWRRVASRLGRQF